MDLPTRSSPSSPTRSSSRKVRLTDAVATGPFGALSHDELGVIFDGLADPLQPVVAVALSSTCLGLRTPLKPALGVLKERHARAVALCKKVDTSFWELRDAEDLDWEDRGLTADDMATLAMILVHNGLPNMFELQLYGNPLGDAGVQTLFDGLVHGGLSLAGFICNDVEIGPAGAEALAAALRKGAMPKLHTLFYGYNDFGDQGVASLATQLRKHPALECLFLTGCGITDEGVASLLDDLGKDDFKKLTGLYIDNNEITDKGCATIAAALDGGLPMIQIIPYGPISPFCWQLSNEAHSSVADRLDHRAAVRAARRAEAESESE